MMKMKILTKKKLTLFIIFLSIFIFVSIWIKINQDEEKKEKRKSICISTLDSRYEKEDFEMLKLNNLKELKLFWKEKMQGKSNILSKILFLNKSYSLKHNFKFLVSNCSSCEKWKQNNTLHESWMKLNFVEEIMIGKKGECDFVLWLDSDAYIWNIEQTIDLYDWFSTNKISEENHNYVEHSYLLNKHKYNDLFKQNKTLHIAKNGVLKIKV